MEIHEFVCWRPAFQETEFQDFEPIHDIERLYECNPLYITLFLTYDDRKYEYELHYHNNDRKVELQNIKLNTCQYGPSEDVTLIEGKMKPMMGLFAATTIPSVFSLLYDNLEKERE